MLLLPLLGAAIMQIMATLVRLVELDRHVAVGQVCKSMCSDNCGLHLGFWAPG